MRGVSTFSYFLVRSSQKITSQLRVWYNSTLINPYPADGGPMDPLRHLNAKKHIRRGSKNMKKSDIIRNVDIHISKFFSWY